MNWQLKATLSMLHKYVTSKSQNSFCGVAFLQHHRKEEKFCGWSVYCQHSLRYTPPVTTAHVHRCANEDTRDYRPWIRVVCTNVAYHPKKSFCGVAFQLLIRSAADRLGCGPNEECDIKLHAFYRMIDWQKLVSREVQPPFKPNIVRPVTNSS